MVARKYGQNLRILVKSNRPSNKIHDSLDVLLNDMSLLQNLGDKLSRNRNKFKFSMRLLPFSCLICAQHLYFSQTLLRKAKLA